MSKISIKAQPRKKTKKLRAMIADGTVPGVIYDQKGKSKNIKIAANDVEILMQELSGTPIITLEVDNSSHIALIKEVQKDLRRNVINHISFLSLDPKKEAQFDVTIELSGESPAVKNNLGVLISPLSSIELRGLPSEIPSKILADISNLEKVGDSLAVSDLSIPETLELVHEEDKESVVVNIQPFQKTLEEEKKEEEEAAALLAEEEGEDLDEEVEGAEEGKDEDDGETPSEEAPEEEVSKEE